MRKHHTIRSSGRATVRTLRRSAAGILAGGATAAGVMFFANTTTGAAAPPLRSSAPVLAAAPVRLDSAQLIAARTIGPGVRAVDFARAQIGKPYVWGASGPNAYDCSGLAQAAWRAAGVHLPRTAAAQFRAGHHVPLSAARPGDLVFWSSSPSPAAIYHVGIVVGRGRMVAAPRPGQRVQQQPIYAGAYPVATRP